MVFPPFTERVIFLKGSPDFSPPVLPPLKVSPGPTAAYLLFVLCPLLPGTPQPISRTSRRMLAPPDRGTPAPTASPALNFPGCLPPCWHLPTTHLSASCPFLRAAFLELGQGQPPHFSFLLAPQTPTLLMLTQLWLHIYLDDCLVSVSFKCAYQRYYIYFHTVPGT